jgi:hypothetical protein
VANIYNDANCSLANSTYCMALNRSPCYAVPHTCSHCDLGYGGVNEAANTYCVPVKDEAMLRGIGAKCSANKDCLAHNCTDSLCRDSPKMCPTTDVTSVCSGRGACQAYDNSYNRLYYNDTNSSQTYCGLENQGCFVQCVCRRESFGLDCSLNTEQFVQRVNDRNTMCRSLLAVLEISDPSSLLLESITNTAFNVGNPSQLGSSLDNPCGQLIMNTGTLASDGYLRGTSNNTRNSLATLVSNVVANNFIMSNSATRRRHVPLLTSQQLVGVVTQLSGGVLKTLIDGQYSVEVRSPNLLLTINKIRTRDLINRTVAPPGPPTNFSTSVTFQGNSAQSCTSSSEGNEYSHLAVHRWGRNPNLESVDAQSPIFGVKIYTVSESIAPVPNFTYFITLPFNVEQTFTQEFTPGLDLVNITYPACNIFGSNDTSDPNGFDTAGCTVFLYNDRGITCECHSIENLCSAPAGEEPLRDYTFRAPAERSV